MFYHFKLSDGREGNIEARTAADALANCLEAYRGRTVVELHWGGSDAGSYSGIIKYEIPVHSALPEQRDYSPRKGLDNTAHMFDEEMLDRESKRAMSARNLTDSVETGTIPRVQGVNGAQDERPEKTS